MSHSIFRGKKPAALAASYNPISSCSLEWQRLLRNTKKWEQERNVLLGHCAAGSRTAIILFSSLPEAANKKVHLLDCSLLMRKTFSPAHVPFTVLISHVHLFACHVHLCQHPPRSEASARASCRLSRNLPSPSPAGQIPQERRQPGLSSPPPNPADGPSMETVQRKNLPVHEGTMGQKWCWKLPDSKQTTQ